MAKLKSNRSAAKRVRFTKSGKVKRFRAGKGHLLTSKNAKRRRSLRGGAMVADVDRKVFDKLLPYGR